MGGCAGGPWGFKVNLGDTTSKGKKTRQVVRALNATTPETFKKKRKPTEGELKTIYDWMVRLPPVKVRERDIPKHVVAFLK